MDETNHPENGSTQEEPVPERWCLDPMPADKPKQKTDAAFLTLGLITPFALTLVWSLLAGLLPNLFNGAIAPLYAFSGLAGPVCFVGILVAFFVGRQNGNVKLQSFGKGGLIAYAIVALLALLAFGSCVVLGLTA